jgi:predicted nucleic acid-binding protein
MGLVFDASTLILLAKTTLLQDVTELTEIQITTVVEEECLAKSSFDAALIKQLIQERRIAVQKEVGDSGVKKLMEDFRIGSGEASAIWLARTNELPLAVDDGQAIKVCKALGLQFVTAIHILLILVLRGRLSKEIAAEKLKALSHIGRYTKKIIEDAEQRLKE